VLEQARGVAEAVVFFGNRTGKLEVPSALVLGGFRKIYNYMFI
jgi:hypothetical protein